MHREGSRGCVLWASVRVHSRIERELVCNGEFVTYHKTFARLGVDMGCPKFHIISLFFSLR
jgi:hypothetical protein